jgi:hypothetical protein
VVIGALILSLFGYAQREHWSVYGNDARVAPPGSRAATGGISRHK